jgi:hypothetical protein
MENVSEKNKNTHFMFNNFFRKLHRLWDIPNNVVETEGPHTTSQYGAYALRAGLAKLHALTRMHTPTRPGTHIHARTRAHKQTNK